MMLRNCSGVCSRDWAVTVAFEHLPLGLGHPADLARGDLDILVLDRGDDVARHQLEALQLVRIEPDPHRIFASRTR